MIIQEFNNGWGPEWSWKQFEISSVNKFLRQVISDTSQTVLINSVWYSQDYHDMVMSWLRQNHWDQIILVAMLDPAIPRPDWYSEFGRPVIAIGYYPGQNQIDLFAMLLADSIDLSVYGDLVDGSNMDTPYICLNRKPHWHRLRLFYELQHHGLLDHGVVSMGSQDGRALRSLSEPHTPNNLAPNSSEQSYGIPNDINSLGPPEIWRRCFFNVVTETVWNINHCGFVSEKIYKPIVGMRPFVVYDPDGGTEWLKDKGFETYENDFRDISQYDPSDPECLIFFLKDLTSQDKKYFCHKYYQLVEKIKFNRENFYRYVQNQKNNIKQGVIL
jgi:hypothetical protein